MMKKNNWMSYLSLGIVFALFNVIAFAIPTDKTATFWTVYVFSIIAFAVQIPLWKIALSKKDTLKSKFLGIPIIYVGITHLIIQLIAFAVFMIFPKLPVWLAVIVCAIVLVIFALCAIAGQAGANEINRIEEKIKDKRTFIQFLQTDIEMLAESETDVKTKAALKKLAEKIRFSDPMSHEMLGELELRISAKVEELKTAADKKSLIDEIEMLLTERNKKCKILK
ncbi:MAG: hypothetical protein IJF05_01325 [Clostridia bacterium]|nr:hypothetical protein [Clostridia bacterium]